VPQHEREDDDWVLVVRPLPTGIPAAVRVRRLLKFAGRVLGLRVVQVRDATPEEARTMRRAEGSDSPLSPAQPVEGR
jgi:hypothetical protein